MIDFSCIKNAFDEAHYIPFTTNEGNIVSSLTEYAFKSINFCFQNSHIEHLKNIQHNSSDERDRLVASIMLENARVASNNVLPLCQDTGVASVYAFIGTESPFLKQLGSFTADINEGVKNAYIKNNLRFSINRPLSFTEETDTKNNTPADINVYLQDTDKKNSYILFSAKGGGSSNKTYFAVKNKSFLNDNSIKDFITERIQAVGTSACPPYKTAFVVGGLSPEDNLLWAKLATCIDIQNNINVIRCPEYEKYVTDIANGSKRGQFNASTLVNDSVVLRLPRHGASVFVSFALSCSASRGTRVKITEDGIFTESLAFNIDDQQCTPLDDMLSSLPHFDVSPSLSEQLKKLPKDTLFTLSGPLTVARDKVHFELKKHNRIPSYMIDNPVFYAGPTETPARCVSGSIGPTTSSRMDEGAIFLLRSGASKVMIGKGERSKEFFDECKKYGGVYVKALGGVAAFTAFHCVKDSNVVDYKEFGMESVRVINVSNMLLST